MINGDDYDCTTDEFGDRWYEAAAVDDLEKENARLRELCVSIPTWRW